MPPVTAAHCKRQIRTKLHDINYHHWGQGSGAFHLACAFSREVVCSLHSASNDQHPKTSPASATPSIVHENCCSQVKTQRNATRNHHSPNHSVAAEQPVDIPVEDRISHLPKDATNEVNVRNAPGGQDNHRNDPSSDIMRQVFRCSQTRSPKDCREIAQP